MWIERFLSHRSRWQGFPEELVVVLVDFLNFFLTPATHSVTDVSLEAEAERHHGIPDAAKTVQLISDKAGAFNNLCINVS